MKKEAINMFTQYKRKIRIVVGLVMFVVGFLISYNFLFQPLTDEQFILCEQVAQDVAQNLPNTISSCSFSLNITDDFSVNVTTDKKSVRVSSQVFYHRPDQVVVNLENDKFIPERKNGIVPAVFVSMIFGSLFFAVGIGMVNIIYGVIKYGPDIFK